MIKFEDWKKMDFRVAEIKKVEDHPNADKLYILTIDVDGEEKTIVAGIRQYYIKKELIGKKIIVFNNLEPTELRGVKSEGMLLAATDENKVVLLTIDKDVNSGAKIS